MRTALGKGLDALISEETAAVTEIPLDRIKPNPKQPRHVIADGALQELSESIAQRGVLQPILVAPLSDGTYEIIVGERRWRAAKRAGFTSIPAVIKSAPEQERFQMAMIENIQREDLSPLEQARGYARLVTEFLMTQEAIAVVMGKDRAVIANTLRLLSLPAEMQSALSEGKISASHGRSLAALDDLAAQRALFRRILDENLSVRALERAVRDHKQVAVRGHTRGAAHPVKSPEVKSLEDDLQRALSRKVELQRTSPDGKKGWIRLEYYSLEDLDHLVSRLRRVSQPS